MLISAIKVLLLRVWFVMGKLRDAFSILFKIAVFVEWTHLGKHTGALVCQAQGLLVPANICRNVCTFPCRGHWGIDMSGTRTLRASKCLEGTRVCLCMLKKVGCMQRHRLASSAQSSRFPLTKWDAECVKVLLQLQNHSDLSSLLECLLNFFSSFLLQRLWTLCYHRIIDF